MNKKRFCWFNFRFKILFIARIVPLSLKYDYACNYIICGYKWRNMKNQNNNHTLIKLMTHPWNNWKLWLSAHFSSVAVFPLMLTAHRIPPPGAGSAWRNWQNLFWRRNISCILTQCDNVWKRIVTHYCVGFPGFKYKSVLNGNFSAWSLPCCLYKH